MMQRLGIRRREHVHFAERRAAGSVQRPTTVPDRSAALASCPGNAVLISPPVLSPMLFTFGLTASSGPESYGTPRRLQGPARLGRTLVCTAGPRRCDPT